MGIVSKLKWGVKNFDLEWLEGDESLLKFHKPVKQAYGVCLNKKRFVAIVSNDDGRTWTLPGGTVEKGETLETTLRREVIEEADLNINDIKLIGLLKVDDGNNILYQARFVCKIANVLPQTEDPAKGKILKRKFVSLKTLNKYLNWGEIGNDIVRLVLDS